MRVVSRLRLKKVSIPGYPYMSYTHVFPLSWVMFCEPRDVVPRSGAIALAVRVETVLVPIRWWLVQVVAVWWCWCHCYCHPDDNVVAAIIIVLCYFAPLRNVWKPPR